MERRQVFARSADEDRGRAGLLAAIRQRDRSGNGLMVELCLYDSVIPTLTTFLGAMGMGLTDLRDGNRASGGAISPYNAYPTSDGWVMILAGESSIREVIPFPKTARATDLMSDAPSTVSDRVLRELGIRVTAAPAKQ